MLTGVVHYSSTLILTLTLTLILTLTLTLTQDIITGAGEAGGVRDSTAGLTYLLRKLQVTVRRNDQPWIYGFYRCIATNQYGEAHVDIDLKRASK